MRLGLCQLDIVWENKRDNMSKVKHYIEEASSAGVNLLVFPEMTLTGFSMEITKTAESNNETIEFFKQMAIRYNINLGFGWAEAVQSKARNHFSVVSPEGEVLSDYVKIHPFSYAGENEHFIPGNTVKIFTINGVKISPLICYDLRFPEVFQAVSNQSDVIIVIANWPEPRKDHWQTLLKARAIENQAYIAGVNCVGEKNGIYYSGNSMVVEPEGHIVRELENEEGLIIADVFADKVKTYRNQFPLKSDRRIELYKSLI